MKFFPSGADERIGIAEEIAGFASDLEQVKWLVGRLPKLHREWPGLREVRAVFCSKFRPRDGFDVDSDVYLDGVPSEKPNAPQIAAPAVRYLSAPEEPMSPAVQKRMEQLVAEMEAKTQMLKKAQLPTQVEIEAVKALQERNRVVRVQTPAADSSCEPVATKETNSTEASV